MLALPFLDQRNRDSSDRAQMVGYFRRIFAGFNRGIGNHQFVAFIFEGQRSFGRGVESADRPRTNRRGSASEIQNMAVLNRGRR